MSTVDIGREPMLKDNVVSWAFDYVRGPISQRSQNVFAQLIAPITGGAVADIGCGANAYYWAMGYVQRVQSITFADRSSTFLQNLRDSLAGLATANVGEDLNATVQHLKQAGLVDAAATVSSLCSQTSSMADFQVYDLAGAGPTLGRFDYVLCLGSLGCVDNEEQLAKAVQAISEMLKPGGKLHAIWTPYKQRDALADAFIEAGIDGRLNPGLKQFEDALSRCGLNVELLEQRQGPSRVDVYANFQDPIYIICRK